MIDWTRALAILALVASTLCAPAAIAQSPEYLQRSREAIAEADLGHFAEAYALFLQAYRLEPNARAARALGNTAFELRRYADAMRHFEEALSSTERPLTAAQRTEVESMVARTEAFVGRFVLSIEPEVASAALDGSPIDVTQPLWVDLGEHQLAVSAPGHAELARTLMVRGGERESLDLVLAPAGSIAPSALGSIAIVGAPGGRVLVDDVFVCTAPCTAASLAVGLRSVRVERAGLEPYRASVEVSEGEPTTLRIDEMVSTPVIWSLRVRPDDEARLRVSSGDGAACPELVTATSPCTLLVAPSPEPVLVFESEGGAFPTREPMPSLLGGSQLNLVHSTESWAPLGVLVAISTLAGPIITWVLAGVAAGNDASDTDVLFGVAGGVTAAWLAISLPFFFLDPVHSFVIDPGMPLE